MTNAHRVDPRAVLTDFISRHRGVRGGQLFGRPAAFAGRRAFAVVQNGRLAIRVPPTLEPPARRLDPRRGSLRDGGRRRTNGPLGGARRSPASSRWVHCRVPPADALFELVTWLEVAATHAAEETSRLVPAAQCG